MLPRIHWYTGRTLAVHAMVIIMADGQAAFASNPRSEPAWQVHCANGSASASQDSPGMPGNGITPPIPTTKESMNSDQRNPRSTLSERGDELRKDCCMIARLAAIAIPTSRTIGITIIITD